LFPPFPYVAKWGLPRPIATKPFGLIKPDRGCELGPSEAHCDQLFPTRLTLFVAKWGLPRPIATDDSTNDDDPQLRSGAFRGPLRLWTELPQARIKLRSGAFRGPLRPGIPSLSNNLMLRSGAFRGPLRPRLCFGCRCFVAK